MSKKMNPKNLDAIRHSLSHLMSMAISELYPKVGLGMGPAIENGFYQDYDLPETITPEIFPRLEKRMRELIKQDIKFKQHDVAFAEAYKFYKHDPYKTEIINDLKTTGEKKVSFYKSGWFDNLCDGPHVSSTKEINPEAFKLISLAGAYWKGSEKNKMLTRIYGVAFETKKELENYLAMQEEAGKRDHRKLGKELDLFIFSDLVGPGLPLYTAKGAIIRNEIINYSRQLQEKIGYKEVHTPNINKAELFKVSGHYDKYKEDMFKVISNYTDEEYYLKPMNCPQHTQLYASQLRSYRDLPIRIADFANLYRDEKPGELSGLTRLRSFCQDDAHCFCREDQIEEEFANVLKVIEEALKTYGLPYWIRLSLRDEANKNKYLGNDSIWKKSQKILENILIKNKIKYKRAPGEAAFYGPKMDVMAKDTLGREWQISTIQLDFNMPERFELEYIDEQGKKKTPMMIHRAIIGSPERFLGILIEHYAGAFPVWLSPVQAVIIPISEKFKKYAHFIGTRFIASGIRAEVDDSDETLGKRIAEAEKQKIPYMLIVGEKEEKAKTVTVRKRADTKQEVMKIEKIVERIREEIDKKL